MPHDENDPQRHDPDHREGEPIAHAEHDPLHPLPMPRIETGEGQCFSTAAGLFPGSVLCGTAEWSGMRMKIRSAPRTSGVSAISDRVLTSNRRGRKYAATSVALVRARATRAMTIRTFATGMK